MLTEKFGCFIAPDGLAVRLEMFNERGEILWHQLPRGIIFQDRFRDGERKEAILLGCTSQTQGVILNVNGNPATPAIAGSHWILALRQFGDDWVCADPWTGKECLAKRDYRNIIGHALLAREGADIELPVDIRYGKDRNAGLEIAFFTLDTVRAWFRNRRSPYQYIDRRQSYGVVYGGWTLQEVLEPTRFRDWTNLTKEEWRQKTLRFR